MPDDPVLEESGPRPPRREPSFLPPFLLLARIRAEKGWTKILRRIAPENVRALFVESFRAGFEEGFRMGQVRRAEADLTRGARLRELGYTEGFAAGKALESPPEIAESPETGATR